MAVKWVASMGQMLAALSVVWMVVLMAYQMVGQKADMTAVQ